VPVEPLALVLDRREVWPNGVASLQSREQPPALRRLHRASGDALAAAGVALERRPWKPHVTLVRRASGALLPQEPFALGWSADAFVLVESKPGGGGYVVLDTYPRTSATGSAPKSARSR